ncbi:MAG: type VII secretion protein EssC [Lachnospiraceae bacterium]|nr:type VII secretion protein EssC [Lachnospiraceae bacterium]
MSYILLIYSKNAFKEFLLPAINNADSSIVLSKNIFQLSHDLEIGLEIVDGKWFFNKERDFSLAYTANREAYAEKPLVGGDLLTITLKSGQILHLIVKEIQDSFRVYKKYNISNINGIRIGNSENSDIQYNFLKLVSKDHGSIVKNGNQYIVQDTSSNGIFINSVRMTGSWQLSFGDCIDIFGLRMVFLGDILAVNEGVEGLRVREDKLMPFRKESLGEATPAGQKIESVLFHRSPRKISKLDTEPVEIEAPPAPKEPDKRPLAMIIGPSLTMALPMLLGCSLSIYGTQASGGGGRGIFMYTGLVTAITSAMIGMIWSLTNIRYGKKKSIEDETRRFESYSEYLIKCAETIKSKYEKNTMALKEMYHSAEECCNYSENTVVLWNRNVTHSDVLYHRLGIGDIPFQVQVNIPKEKFKMINDSLSEKPRMIKESYALLKDVPVGVDLMKHRLIGVFGGEKKKGAMTVLYNLVAQIAANNCYTDVKMVFIYDEKKYDDTGEWNFAKWLPHVWSEDKKSRYVAKNKSEASDVLYELTQILRMRQESSEHGFGEKERFVKPYYIVFVADPELLEGELISKYIFESKSEYGMTTLLLEETYEQLSNACKYLIQNNADFKGAYSVDDDDSEKLEIRFDMASPIALEQLARRLANIEVNEIETGGEIPNALTFFEMHGVNRLEELNVMERWRKNRTYDSMKALVGQKSGGAPCYLDVHEKYHGPHGLVAGTTGSGKSETLQTYMLSLALNFSPDDIGFFIIDYKGGGMANLFSGLPHIIGQISNLSGNQVRRAMVSIKSENMRRQRIFNEHGVNNINLYTKLYKNNEATLPVPHMFIIIDEFAELKREEPDFMRELISVAQVGRSLGVHLILATQKPSGTVDDNIWSNSKFKLCLRVQDKQDSNDMLHKPDAAYITQAGRCYLQVGNDELYELFQSGYSGATYDDSEDVITSDIAKMVTNTGKAALVGSYAKIQQKNARKQKWISYLIGQLEETAKSLNVIPEAVASDPTQKKNLFDAMLKQLEKEGAEYPDSDYNRRRLEDLLHMYVVASASVSGSDRTAMANTIIKLAGTSGKKLPESKEKTQLDAVVEYLDKIAKENGYTHNLQLWLPVLPTHLYLDELEGYGRTAYREGKWISRQKEWDLSVYMGLCDDPVNQAQMPMILDLSNNGHHAICGVAVSGKSTFLQTFVYSMICKYTPAAVSIYGIDYGSKMLAAFEQAPHVGGLIYEGEDDRLAKFFTMLSGIIEERKVLFRGGNYSQYVQVHGITLPAIVLVIDNFGNFRAKTDNKYDDFFLQLAKDGVSYGVFIVMTGGGFGMTEIPGRIGDNIRTTISLEMKDKFQYGDIMRTMKIETLPEENVKGRGLIRVGESILEYQTALALRAENDFKRSEAIAALATEMKAAWSGKRAKRIPEIPEKFIWSEFAETEEVEKMLADDRRLPVGYDTTTVAVYGVDLSKNYCYLMSGKSRTGKTNMLKVLMQSAALKGGKLVVIDFADELKAMCEGMDVTYVPDDNSLYNYLGQDLLEEFKVRNGKKKTKLAEGLSDDEIFESMNQEERIYIFLPNLAEFIQHIYRPGNGAGQMNALIENLWDKGSLHNIYWFGCIRLEDVNEVSGMRAYNLFIKEKKGAHFGGNVSAQRIFSFDYLPFAEQSKSEKVGIAMLPASEENVRKVAVPQCK